MPAKAKESKTKSNEKSKDKTVSKVSLEERFDELDKMIEKMESEDITLEESFAEYQKGIEMIKLCHEEIESIESRVRILNENGQTEDFE